MPTATARRGGGRPRNLTRREKNSPDYEAFLEREARASDRRNRSARNPMTRPGGPAADPHTPDEGDWSRPPPSEPAPVDEQNTPPPGSEDDEPSGPGFFGRHLGGGGAGAGETGGGLILGALGYALLLSLVNYGASGPKVWLKAKFLNQPTAVPGAKTSSATSGPATGVLL